ncbi:hypothetical protein Moror_2425 [Moniliophthora roreri MCA 2997]|uniref:Decapping nuclease n=2 Tax=Moniliophthora roreri TaxID=221103 RepID=V2WG24_MONRO|nr:hypothetical protein Moror_2425 [Moniliophthora roreri MCA 2997]KAI3605467.1 hypothetical protein WG66_005922 [Moniliophthora roreri]
MSTEAETSEPQQMLGQCKLIAHISVEENGAYKANDETAIPIFSTSLRDSCLDLGPRVRQIEKQRPFRYFKHPKHLDSIIWGCIAAGKCDFFKSSNTIVTWRGILTKIFLGEAVTLHVSYIDGTLFMEEEDPKPQWRARHYAESDAVGKAFEDLYTKPHANSSRSPNNGDKHSSKQWGNVVSRSLGDLSLVFCGEVDAVKDQFEKGADGGEWFSRRVELKCKLTETRIPNQRWHMQSYLLGVPEIFIGYRSKNLRIVRTQMIQVSDIQTPDIEAKISRGHSVLSALRAELKKEKDEGSIRDDTIWKIAIRNGSWKQLQRLGDVDAQKVKKRRDDPSKPIQRIGIVPEVMLQHIREDLP